MEILSIPINKIKPDPKQPRQKIDQERIEDIAKSIKTEGIINPIEIDSDFVIITGEMRWRAAKIAGLTTIPAKLIEIDSTSRFRRQVIENIHHNTMTAWDTAKALQRLLVAGTVRSNDKGYSKLAREIGKSESTIRDYLLVLSASQPMKVAIKKGTVSAGMMRALGRTPEKFRRHIESKIVAGEFNNRQDAYAVADALVAHPEKATEILKMNSAHDVYAFFPRMSDIVMSALKPPQQLATIKRELLEWIKKNPPESTIKINAPQILLTLDLMVNAIQEWGKKSKKL